MKLQDTRQELAKNLYDDEATRLHMTTRDAASVPIRGHLDCACYYRLTIRSNDLSSGAATVDISVEGINRNSVRRKRSQAYKLRVF